MSNPVQTAVERVLAQVLDERLPALRSEIAQRVLQEIGQGTSAKSGADELNAALGAIQQSTSQAEILTALLDGMARFNSRVALFVLRSETAQGWQARGLTDNESVKAMTVNVGAGLVARAVQTRGPVIGGAADFDPQVVAAFGRPTDGKAVVVPLVVRDKVAAVLYADAGTQPEGRVDAAAAELLVRAAAVWVELCAARKTGAAPAAEAAEKSAAAAAVASAPMSAAAPEQAAAPAETAASAEDEEVHRKAKRFAKLLVEEIKLYNQAKVAEGRQNRDLWDRLQTDIAKSRATYDKRYAETVAAAADYFTQELIRVLANGDTALLGSSFPG